MNAAVSKTVEPSGSGSSNLPLSAIIFDPRLRMKTTIYYFSGTGNSLAIARDMALELGDAEVVSIAALESNKRICTDADAVGIVYPVYALGLPLIVERFISRLDLEKDRYVFTVANYAKMQGAALTRARRLLKKRGITPKAGFGILMPNNYLPFGEAGPEEKQRSVLGKEKEKIKRIAGAVKKKRAEAPETGFFLTRWLIAEPVCLISASMMPGEDKNFHVNDKCNGCGICREICPVNNIEIKLSSPRWKHHCENCMACLHWCPREAIQFGKNTAGKKRYHHPSVTINDFGINL